MKKLFFNSSLISTLIAATFVLGSCEKDADDQNFAASAIAEAGAQAETAQSIMMDIVVDAPVIEAGGFWKFDYKEAMTYVAGGTVHNQKAAVESQKCTFYYGGTLNSKSFGKVTVSPINNAVMPQTAWAFISSENGASTADMAVDVAVDVTIAGESVVVNKGKAKYSFTMLDQEGNPRISNLKVEVVGQEEVLDPAFSVIVGNEANACLADVLYTGNAGTFGRAQNSLKTNMTMGEIIAMNQYGSTSACGNATIVQLEQLHFNLKAGSYTIKVSGMVKGNAGEATMPFEVKKNVTVGTVCQD